MVEEEGFDAKGKTRCLVRTRLSEGGASPRRRVQRSLFAVRTIRADTPEYHSCPEGSPCRPDRVRTTRNAGVLALRDSGPHCVPRTFAFRKRFGYRLEFVRHSLVRLKNGTVLRFPQRPRATRRTSTEASTVEAAVVPALSSALKTSSLIPLCSGTRSSINRWATRRVRAKPIPTETMVSNRCCVCSSTLLPFPCGQLRMLLFLKR